MRLSKSSLGDLVRSHESTIDELRGEVLRQHAAAPMTGKNRDHLRCLDLLRDAQDRVLDCPEGEERRYLLELAAVAVRWAATLSLLMMAGCPGPFWGRICLGGTTSPSEACVVLDGSYIAVVGGVSGAHALNHDPYDAVTAALRGATDAGAVADGGVR